MNLKTQLAALKSVCFSYNGTTAILLPLLPIYFAEKGYGSDDIGMFMMIGPFVAIFAQPVWGYLSDRLHTVKKIILLLWLCTIGASIGLFQAGGYTSTLLFVLLLYFFMFPSVPLLDSITIRSTTEAKVHYGTVRKFGSIGFAGVALVSGLLLPYVGGISSMKYMYWLLWILPMAGLLFLKDHAGGGPRITIRATARLLKNKEFLWYLLLIFILTTPHRANDVLFSLYMKDAGAKDWMVSGSWALAAGSEVLGFWWAGRYARRYHDLPLLGVISVLYALRWVIYGMVRDPWALFFLQLTQSVTFGVFWMTAVAYVTRLVPKELLSTGQSLLASVFLGLAGIAGGTAGGWVQKTWGGPALYYAGAGVAVMAALLFFATYMRSLRLSA